MAWLQRSTLLIRLDRIVPYTLPQARAGLGLRCVDRTIDEYGMPNFSLGIDIGGTFTDIVFYDHESGRQYSRKILTTQQNPAAAVIEGTEDLIRKHGINPRAVRRAIHATTLFTNALIERKGARTGLITTLGFRDVLEIGRERKYDLYDIG